MLKEQINFFSKPGSGHRVKKQSTMVMMPSYPSPLFLIVIITETSLFLPGKSQLCWQGKWEWLVVWNKGWEGELLDALLGPVPANLALAKALTFSIPHLPFFFQIAAEEKGLFFSWNVLNLITTVAFVAVGYLGQ